MECFTPYVNKLILQIILLRKMCFLHLKSDSSGTLNAHLNLKLKLQCIVPEIDAVKFEETGIGGLELDAAEGRAVVELETGELTVTVHVAVVGSGDDFHKPRQHDNK